MLFLKSGRGCAATTAATSSAVTWSRSIPSTSVSTPRLTSAVSGSRGLGTPRVGGQRGAQPHGAGLGGAAAVVEQELPRQVGAVDLEALVGAPVVLGQAEVVEHRADVEQLGVGLDFAVAALQAREEEHSAGVVEQQRGAGLADQLGGPAGALGVGDVDPGDRLGHVLRLSRRVSFYFGGAP